MDLERGAVYALPVVAGLAIAGLLLGPGAERVVLGARLYGSPGAGTDRVAVRAMVLAHYDGLYHAAKGVEVRLHVGQGGTQLGSYTGRSNDLGLVEVGGKLASALEPSTVELSLTSRGRTLAEGGLAPLPPLDEAPRRRPSAPLDVFPTRGFVVPEMPEEIVIRGATAMPTVTADGALASKVVEGDGVHRVNLTAKAPVVELEVKAGSAEWRGPIRVLAGGMWLAPGMRASGTLSLRAAVPKKEAFVSLWSRQGRIWGAIVPMTSDAQGFSQGSAALPPLPPPPLMAVVSSDETEPEANSVAWPIDPEAPRQLDARAVSLLIDGLPSLVAAEKRRMGRARWPVVGFVLASGLLELLLLQRLGRRSRRKLEHHIAVATSTRDGSALGPDEARAISGKLPLGWLIVLVGALALAFAMLAAVAALA